MNVDFKTVLEYLLGDNLVSPVFSIDLSGEPLGFKGPSILALVDGFYETMSVEPKNFLLHSPEVHTLTCWLTWGHWLVTLIKPESNIKRVDLL